MPRATRRSPNSCGPSRACRPTPALAAGHRPCFYCRRSEATAFLGEIAHLINVVFNALEKRESRYASLMGALLDLAGEPPRAVQIADEDAIDAVWDEPVAFDGCSSGAAGAGTAPDQPQPVHLVRRAARQAPTPPGATA